MNKRYNQIKKSIEEDGLFNKVVKDASGLIIDGSKRLQALATLERKGEYEIRNDIQTVKDHLRALRGINPPVMSPDEKRFWAKVYATMYKKAGWSKSDIVEAISVRFGCSNRSVYRYLPDELKSDVGRPENKNLPTVKLFPSNIKEDFSFLESKELDLLHRLYSKNKKVIDLLYHVKRHGESVRLPSTNELLSNANINELLEVTFNKLDESKYPKLDQKSLNFIKFLYQEYFKRDGDNGN